MVVWEMGTKRHGISALTLQICLVLYVETKDVFITDARDFRLGKARDFRVIDR